MERRAGLVSTSRHPAGNLPDRVDAIALKVLRQKVVLSARPFEAKKK
jgi:hypothetical protein